jgi:hypothetical protein
MPGQALLASCSRRVGPSRTRLTDDRVPHDARTERLDHSAGAGAGSYRRTRPLGKPNAVHKESG